MAGKIKGCTHYPTKLVTKAATGGIMTVPQKATNPGVQPYKMPAQPANTQAQQRAQAAKDNYGSIASDYMAKAAARRAAPAAAAPAYKKTNMADLEKRYGLNQAPPPAAAAAASKPADQSRSSGPPEPPQGSAASRNTKWDTYNSPADTKARAMSYGPQPKPKGFTSLKDMFDGGGPGASKAKPAASGGNSGGGKSLAPTSSPRPKANPNKSSNGSSGKTAAPSPSNKYSANDKKGNSKSGSSGGSASKGRDKSR